MIILEKMGITYKIQKTFPTCKNKRCLRFDFYLPKQNLLKEEILIEFQGTQHYYPFGFFSKEKDGVKKLKQIQKHDQIKREWANKNDKNLLEIPYWDIDNIKEIFKGIIK